MFPARYFTRRYWTGRFWPPVVSSSGSAFPAGFYESDLSLSVTPVMRSLDVTPTERSLSVTQTERTLIFQER